MQIMQAILICLSLVLAPGPGEAELPRPVVTGIRMEARGPGGKRAARVEEPGTMAGILNRLRQLPRADAVGIDPETFRAEELRVTVELSDGSTREWRQVAGDFFQKNGGAWRPIPRGDGLQFPGEWDIIE